MKRLKLDRMELHRGPAKPRSGDACPDESCDGRLHVYSSHVRDQFRFKYLCCDTCKAKPEKNKITVPIEFAPPRRRR